MRVLVADDHSLFRDGIVSLLEAAGLEVVGEAGDGREAVKLAQELKPDLVLMDIAMPRMSGLQALREMKERLPESNVVMLTVSDDDENLVKAAQAGASGYLLKSLDAEEFLSLLNGIQAGEAPMTRKTTARLLERMASGPPPKPADHDLLTEREIELLGQVALGLPNKAIAQELSISENTVKYHMKNILAKLDVNNRTEAVAIGLRTGLINPEALPGPRHPPG